MPVTNSLITIFWIAFVVYWLVSAIGVKPNVRGGSWARGAGIRILITVAVVLLLQASSSWRVFSYTFDFGVQVLGVALCGVGIAFAIWARMHLGRNWSGTPSIKEEHELVTSGPYRFVRHPIYTGMILALFGSALVTGALWFIVFLFLTANFLYRIPVEERYMMQLFPNQYPEYRKRTKALIPFIW
jgi:protein-S-isoprenylcysteine O-methyltransferase Ste14